MILDKTGDIMQALISDIEIVKWVSKVNGVPNISANKTPSAVFPAIVVYEILNGDSKFADDKVVRSKLSYQISLYSLNGSHTKVQQNVDKFMREMGFTLNFAGTAQDTDTKIFQRDLKYKGEFDI